jgi:ABC-type multidrug transport system permease subunit
MRLFFRDIKSPLLVILTPFLILTILINIFYFSDVAENIRGVKLGICDVDGSNFELKSEIFEINSFQGNCEQTVASMVAKGDLRGAIVVPQNFEKNLKEGKGGEIKLYLDDSKSTTAVVTSNAVKAYVSDLNEKMGTDFILEAWKKLNELNENLRFLVTNLERAKPVAIQMQQKLEEISKDIAAVDFEKHQTTFDEIIVYLDEIKVVLEEFEKETAVLSIDEYKIPLSQNISNKILEYKTNSKEYVQKFCNNSINETSVDEPTCLVIEYLDSSLYDFENIIPTISIYEDEMNTKIKEVNERIEAIERTAENISMPASEQSNKFSNQIQELKQELLFLNEKTKNITQSITELNKSINTFVTDLISTTNDLNKTIGVLEEYTQKNPANIIRAVRVETKPVFKDKLQIFYRLPGLMSIVLLFITLFISASVIVNERKSGTMARIFLSPISMFFYVFEKIIYLLVLCTMAIFSMILATLVFGVFIKVGIELVIVLIIASLTYITIGILIGAISKSENTSLLTCLVVGFPLMFLSGAFSTPELMNKIIRTAAQYLPLTLNIDIFEKITIYGVGLDITKILIMTGMIVIFYLFSVVMIWKKPTLK